MTIDGTFIEAVNFKPYEGELEEYYKYVKEHAELTQGSRISVHLQDDDSVIVQYVAPQPPFERIRRITGYLTGDLKTWNDAKQAEERERVKHI